MQNQEMDRADQGEPFEDLEVVLAAIAHAMTAKGRLEDARAFAKAEIDLEYREHDNWDGGTSVWDLVVRIPYPVYAAYTEKEIEELQKFIDRVVGPFLPDYGHWVHSKLCPQKFQDPNWRQNVLGTASCKGVNNQGRVRSDNVASLEHDGLLFRSDPEILLYKALKRTGIPFAPLPVFLRGGERYSRVEPDFVLLKDGVVLFVEIDGDAFHKESPTDAHYRLKPFQDEGVIVERVKAADCGTQDMANKFARTLVQLIEKRIRQR